MVTAAVRPLTLEDHVAEINRRSVEVREYCDLSHQVVMRQLEQQLRGDRFNQLGIIAAFLASAALGAGIMAAAMLMVHACR